MLSGSTVGPAAGNESGPLALSDGMFERLMRSSPVAIVVTNAGRGRILDVNDAFLRLFQYDRHGGAGPDLTRTGDVGQTRRVRSGLACGRWQAAHRSVISKQRWSPRTGEVRHVLVSVEVIDLDGTSCLLAQLYDVTERRQLEERLQTPRAPVSCHLRQHVPVHRPPGPRMASCSRPIRRRSTSPG